jgi:Thioesterase-like superfamily
MTLWCLRQLHLSRSPMHRLLPAQVLFDQQAPISTMTWAFDVLTDDLETEGGWWLIRVSAESVLNGYSSQATTVWSSTGQRVLVGHQNVAVFG